MANIAIYVGGSRLGTASGFRLSGGALVSPVSEDISWETADIAFTATTTQVNQAIQDAAIAVAEAAGYTIGALDTKIIIGAIGAL